MAKQRQSQKSFITLVTGGPNIYQGQDMKKAHEKMKITKLAFDETWSNLNKSLNDHNVPQNLIDELKEVFYSVEGDIVNAWFSYIVIFIILFLSTSIPKNKFCFLTCPKKSFNLSIIYQ